MKTKHILNILASLTLFLLSKSVVLGQTQQPIPPDCVVPFQFTTNAQTAPGGTNGFDNRFNACTTWTIQYQSVGFSALTLTFESSVGALTPTLFGTYTGTTDTGSNPATNTTGGIATFSNGTTTTPFVRMKVSGLTGSGTITGSLYGYRTGYPGGGGGSGGGGCVGTTVTPCVVVGNVNNGSASAGAPVQVAGSDGTNVRRILTDTGGRTAPSSASVAGADGVSNTVNTPTTEGGTQLYNRVFPFIFNGTTNDRQYNCPNQARINIASATGGTIITGGVGTTIRICHIDFSSDTTATVTILQGTGTVCATSPTTLAGGYQNTVAMVQDYTPLAPLKTTTTNVNVCLTFSTTVTAGGLVTYAQF